MTLMGDWVRIATNSPRDKHKEELDRLDEMFLPKIDGENLPIKDLQIVYDSPMKQTRISSLPPNSSYRGYPNLNYEKELFQEDNKGKTNRINTLFAEA